MKARFEAIYTAALADVLDARGYRHQTLPPAIRPLTPGLRLAGPAYTVQGRPAETTDCDATLRSIAESVLVEAETKAAIESEIRAAVRDGTPPLAAYEQYGTF